MLEFVNLSLYKRGQAGTLFPDSKKTIAGRDSSSCVGGPCIPTSSVAYEGILPDNGSLSHEQMVFNYRLSKA